MIRVVNLKTYVKRKNEILIKVDRSNKVLGNKFVMKTEADRDDVCDKYDNWFNTQISNKNQVVLKELREIYKLALKYDIALGCWCYPKRCHAFTIKKFIDSFLPKPTIENPEESLMVVSGDILKIKEGMIIHQVNNCGKMGAGLAKNIRNLYPNHYSDYIDFYTKHLNGEEFGTRLPSLLGKCVDTKKGDLTIRGIFSQDGYGRDKCYTIYGELRKCLNDIAQLNLPAVYIPHGLGCGLAGGDWREVSSIILDTLPSAIIVKLP